ncbi:MAG TPA: hypothetical protein PK883_00425 [Anaerolineaceae bacterium]|nr:hypothetical protein [Anaerolineaceae bacterium]
MAKIKRSEVMTFMNTTPLAAATYKLIGDGVTTGAIEYNPKTTEETYIHEDSATISVESYAPSLPVEAIAVSGDEVFEFIDALRVARAVLDDAETDIVNVWAYESGGPTAYPAEKQNVSIQIDEFGGDGGQSVKINYTINFIGDPVPGTFNANTSAFTPS